MPLAHELEQARHCSAAPEVRPLLEKLAPQLHVLLAAFHTPLASLHVQPTAPATELVEPAPQATHVSEDAEKPKPAAQPQPACPVSDADMVTKLPDVAGHATHLEDPATAV